MTDLFRETIFALSSGRLPAGIAVIRISGSGARFALKTMCGTVPPPRLATHASVRNPSGELIDHGLILNFPAPRSFTGEDCVELHVHGGPAVVSSVLRTLGELKDFRSAEPGEFSRRAFLNGKFDLTGAEALSDLINAETEWQRRLAIKNAEGDQWQLYNAWCERLLRARALIEAELDFSDEADVPGSVATGVWSDIDRLRAELLRHIEGFSKAEVIREGLRVVIIGAPNSGKSTLLNALARRDVAIVSDEPGTTRDLVEVALDLEGMKVIVTDTAGIRSDAGKVEQIGIKRALDRAGQGHLVLLLEDVADPQQIDVDLPGVPTLEIGSKADLMAHPAKTYDLSLSAKEGIGMADLLARLAGFASEAVMGGEAVLPSRIRHVHYLRDCAEQLNLALDGGALGLELRAEHLRQAATSLARITGAVDVEDLLGVIFSEFCIGK